MNWTEFELLTEEQLWEKVQEIESEVEELTDQNQTLESDLDDAKAEIDELWAERNDC